MSIEWKLIMDTVKKIKYIISLCLKAIIITAAIIGVYYSQKAGEASFMGGSTVFLYFTIQSNILVALIAAIDLVLILIKKNNHKIWSVIKLVGTVSITLTGVVFCVVLAPTMGKNAFNMQNVLTHVVVPLATIMDLFMITEHYNFKKLDVIYTTIPPLLYTIFAAIGFVTNLNFGAGNNYPYFFLNWGSDAGAFGFTDKLPFIGTVYWIIILLGFIIGIGLLYIFIINRIERKHK